MAKKLTPGTPAPKAGQGYKLVDPTKHKPKGK